MIKGIIPISKPLDKIYEKDYEDGLNYKILYAILGDTLYVENKYRGLKNMTEYEVSRMYNKDTIELLGISRKARGPIDPSPVKLVMSFKAFD